MTKNIAIISGDGIGVEIIKQAKKILKAIESKFNHSFNLQEVLAGGCAIDVTGKALPEQTLKTCLEADSVLLGAVGGPKWDNQPPSNRPESALLKIRKELGLYANIRPALLLEQLKDASPLKPSILAKGIDFIIVRELIGGVYFGTHKTEIINNEKVASDDMRYSESQIRQIAHSAFQIANSRKRNLVSVDKANVLDSSRLWREVVESVASEYPSVKLSHMYVDNAAMQLCKDPSQFDVILTENMFGDILSDEASMITGTIGTIPSASLGQGNKGLYEPIHGSAPDIAGQDKANPIGTILSVAMMLDLSFGLRNESESIVLAVQKTLDSGFRTGDMMSEGKNLVGCEKMGDIIASNI